MFETIPKDHITSNKGSINITARTFVHLDLVRTFKNISQTSENIHVSCMGTTLKL